MDKADTDEKDLIDINKELQKTNLQLKEIEGRLDFALTSSNIGAWELSLKDHSAVRTLQHDQIFGYHQLLPHWTYEMFLDHVVEEDKTLVDTLFKKAISEKTLWDFECRIKRKDGQIRWIWAKGKQFINDQGEPEKMSGIVQDITERKLSEKQLEHWKQLMEFIIKHDPNSIAVFDKEMNFIYTSEKFIKDYKIKDKNIIGKNHYEVFPDLPQKWKDIHQRVLKGEILKNEDDSYSRQDGSIDYTRWECRPWHDINGSIGGLVLYSEVINTRKQSEQALRESEEQFRNLFAHSTAMKILINPKTGMIENANKSAARFYGWSIEELVSMPVSRLFMMDEQQMKNVLDYLMKGDRDFYEYLHQRKDGTLVNVEIFSSIIKAGNKTSLHFIIHDITEKKKNEKQVKLLNSSIEQNPVSILITDKDGKIEYVNPAFSKVTGYTTEEVKGLTPNILSSGMNKPLQIKGLWNTILNGEIWNGELLNKRKTGELYWINCTISPIENEAGEITHFVSVREDITERKIMMEEINIGKKRVEESEKKLKEAQAIAKMGHWEFDIKENYLFWSDEIFRIFDAEPGDFKANYEAFLSFVHPDDKQMVDDAYKNSVENKEPYEVEHRVITSTKAIKWVQEKGNTELDEKGNPAKSFGIVIDITERKQYQKELEETNKSLQDMVYVASHDLQVPLVSMEGYASELLENYHGKLDEDGHYCLTRLKSNAHRMHKLVLSLLDISRLNTIKKEYQSFNLTQMIGKITSDLSLTIEKNKAVIKIQPLPNLFADKIRMESVFRNIIANALVYGGKNIVVGSKQNCVFIKDDGIGIPAGQLERIFEPGERLKVISTEGVGMGLTFCKKVIEQHGAQITAYSPGPNKGTTFFINFNSNNIIHVS
jgi:PAS domain S-box-containing protein